MAGCGVSSETDTVCNLSEKEGGGITTTCLKRMSELSVEQLACKSPQSANALQLEVRFMSAS